VVSPKTKGEIELKRRDSEEIRLVDEKGLLSTLKPKT